MYAEDIYTSAAECEKNKNRVIFKDKNAFKRHYKVLYTWPDVIDFLAEYTPPKIIYSAGKVAEIPKFYRQGKQATRNTLFYVFYKYRSGLYFSIREGRIKNCAYLYNENYLNPNAKKFKIEPRMAKKFLQNRQSWIDLGAVVVPFVKSWDDYAIDFYAYEIYSLVAALVKERKINDCDFVVNNKDRLMLKRDQSEASEEIVGSPNAQMPKKFVFGEMIPILGFNWNSRYADIPICTPDDIQRIFGLFSPPYCKNIYLGFADMDTPKWSQRKPIAVFRGSFTGGSVHIKKNPRLHISLLATKWKKLKILDAGLTAFTGKNRGRKEIDDDYIRFLEPHYMRILGAEPLTYAQQTQYKYIVYIEGNVGAYRGAALFRLGCVVIWVQSPKYHLWFEQWLRPFHNVMCVKPDLSDLKQCILWLRANDDKAQQIAANGQKFYDQYLSREPILDYCQCVINAAAV